MSEDERSLTPPATLLSMPTATEVKSFDLTFRDPWSYKDALLDLGECNLSFDYWKARHMGIEPQRWMRINFGSLPWRSYHIDRYQVAELDYTCKQNEPLAVYPSWDFGAFDLNKLQDFIEHPWGQRPPPETYDLGWFERPVFNQPHKVFVYNLDTLDPHNPLAMDRFKKKILKLRKIQQLYPEVELVLDNPKSFDVAFGLDFTAANYWVRGINRYACVVLPNGRKVPTKELEENSAMIRACGFTVEEAKKYYDHFNIMSIRYAAHHWNDPTSLSKTKRKNALIDTHSPTALAGQPVAVNAHRFPADAKKPTDQIACDACSLWRFCNLYKKGSVCTVSGTESRKLSEMAGSRDGKVVVDMLAKITHMQAERVERMANNETFASGNEMDPQLDKALNNLFKNGVTLAKLLDPSLGRPLVQINQQITPAQIVAGSDPRTLVASVVEQLEAQGHRREDITREMIENAIRGDLTAIEATVVEEGE